MFGDLESKEARESDPPKIILIDLGSEEARDNGHEEALPRFQNRTITQHAREAA